MVPVSEGFPVALEHGDGIVGYQDLHATNATVGGHRIDGRSRLVLEPAPGRDAPGTTPDGSGPHTSATGAH